MYDILVVDGNGIAYRAGAVLQLKNDRGENTSVSFGVMNMIRSMIERFDIKDICVCWDYKGSASKRRAYPDYKKKRKPHDALPDHYKEIQVQINRLFEILPAFGIKQLRREGVEADDIIGILCEGLVGQSKQVLALSSDQDLLQLVALGADVYYPHKDLIFTKGNFEAEMGVKPEDFIFYKALKGDSGDNIKGLSGFGPVTAKKFINKYGSWVNWYEGTALKPKIYLDGLNSKQRVSIKGGLETLILNYTLMSVGWLDKSFTGELMEDFNNQHPIFEEEKVKEYFLDQQFDSMVNRWRAWTHPFRMLTWRKT